MGTSGGRGREEAEGERIPGGLHPEHKPNRMLNLMTLKL